jgi:hypothetical protein
VGRSDFQRARRRLQDWAGRLRPAPVLTTERAQQLSSLFAAKDRAHPTSRVGQVVDTRGAGPPPQPVAPILTRAATDEPAEPQPPARSAPKPAAGDGQAPVPVAGGTSATLLAKKRAREKKG